MDIDESPITILSIDGGGIRGIIPAMILHRLDQLIVKGLDKSGIRRRPLVDFFDVIAGTSTGAIIAAALAGKRADRQPLATTEQLIDFYRNDASGVFSSRYFGLLGPKLISGRNKLEELFDVICQGARLSESAANLTVPAFTGPGAFLFRGGPDWSRGSHPDYLLRDVLLATTAAPYLFPPARARAIGQQELHDFIDGGLFANNPAMLAYLDARELFGAQRKVFILSIGTGSDLHPIDYHTSFRWGGFQWLNPLRGVPLVQAMMQGQSNAVHRSLQRLIPDQHWYVRIDFQSSSPLPRFDDASPIALKIFGEIAETLIKQNEDLLYGISRRLSARVSKQNGS